MKLVRPGSGKSIDHLLAMSAEAVPTYSEDGATLKSERPNGYRHDEYESKLGRGPETFLRAAFGLQTWRGHKVPGIDVHPHGAPIELGATVVVTLGTPWLALAAPCRIVCILDEPDRWGFAYGTVPGHPEQGEESFVVSIDGDEEVKFRITAFSRPGERLTRLTGPIGRAVQRAGTSGYVKALQEFVDRATWPPPNARSVSHSGAFGSPRSGTPATYRDTQADHRFWECLPGGQRQGRTSESGLQ